MKAMGQSIYSTKLETSKKQEKFQITSQKQQKIHYNYTLPPDGIPPGGRLKHYIKAWKETIPYAWAWSVIEHGYKLQFEKKPVPWRVKPFQLSPTDQQAVDEAVEQFKIAGVIEPSSTQGKSFLSQFFTVTEPTKIRSILDCRQINQFLQCHHFKMEGIPALRDMLEEKDYMVKIDLKDAYIVVPIHKDSRKFLTFQHQGTVYQYQFLPFGLSVAPRLFSKLMRFALEPLRQRGIRLVYYLDDICLVSKTRQEMNRISQIVVDHLKKLGFIINEKKSDLNPKQIQDFLGFTFNTQTMTITAPQTKLNKLISKIKQLEKSQQETFSCRWIAGLLGKMTSLIPAIGQTLLHMRYLQRDLAVNLRRQQYHWDKPCKISTLAWKELHWWKTQAMGVNGQP